MILFPLSDITEFLTFPSICWSAKPTWLLASASCQLPFLDSQVHSVNSDPFILMMSKASAVAFPTINCCVYYWCLWPFCFISLFSFHAPTCEIDCTAHCISFSYETGLPCFMTSLIPHYLCFSCEFFTAAHTTFFSMLLMTLDGAEALPF